VLERAYIEKYVSSLDTRAELQSNYTASSINAAGTNRIVAVKESLCRAAMQVHRAALGGTPRSLAREKSRFFLAADLLQPHLMLPLLIFLNKCVKCENSPQAIDVCARCGKTCDRLAASDVLQNKPVADLR
jgi:hypothetical protein